MINSSIINNRQNKEELLKIQFAARKCFNEAEKINYLCWIFCCLSALVAFVPDSTTKIITVFIPIILDIFAFIFNLVFNKKLKNAADLRNYFDSQVLMIKNNEYTNLQKQKIRDLAYSIFHNNQAEATISIQNTGKGNPPGVRNWYEFKTEIEGINAQYECQWQNIWWNKKMVEKRVVVFPLIAIIVIVFFLSLFCYFHFDIFHILPCSLGIIMKIAERFIEYNKYNKISTKIDAFQECLESNLTADNIVKLQSLIDERRTIPVLEINLIHQNKAKKYSNLYEELN